MRLILPAVFGEEIARATKIAFPRECCGLIEGITGAAEFRAVALHPARNLATAPDRFEIDPGDHISAMRTAREHGCRIIGCYHSHPNGDARPSPYDRSGAEEKDFIWLIAATDGVATVTRAFVFRHTGFEEISLSEAVGADLVTSSSNERS